jgi:catechol 2,3-dioxygenase-like lactoylglutathione lyase family enzyme
MTMGQGLCTIHHLGYVVDDLAEAARRWHDIAGIGPFLVQEHVPFDGVTADGDPVVFDHTKAYAAYGSLFVELKIIHHAEPASIELLFRPSGGAGLNHVAYVVDDAAAESERLAVRGMPSTVRARVGEVDVALHDGSSSLGFAVEVYQRSDSLTALFEQVRSAAREWDGQDVLRPLSAAVPR